MVRNVTSADFAYIALELFRFQAQHNPVYAQYVHLRNVRPALIKRLMDIPFMPIGFFKNHQIVTQSPDIEAVFESSGTTGSQNSRHFVADLAWYDEISTRIFEQQYGALHRFHTLALLPSYLERNNSSLVYMVQQFIKKNNSNHAGFFLNTT
ncbi:MAG: acyl transferase, partial [Runella slithyformis]